MRPAPQQKAPQISPIFTADKVVLDLSRERTGNRACSTLRSDASKTDLRREVPALR
jgi:hypothetical protein